MLLNGQSDPQAAGVLGALAGGGRVGSSSQSRVQPPGESRQRPKMSGPTLHTVPGPFGMLRKVGGVPWQGGGKGWGSGSGHKETRARRISGPSPAFFLRAAISRTCPHMMRKRSEAT